MQNVKNNGLIKEVRREHEIIKQYCTSKAERFLQQKRIQKTVTNNTYILQCKTRLIMKTLTSVSSSVN